MQQLRNLRESRQAAPFRAEYVDGAGRNAGL